MKHFALIALLFASLNSMAQMNCCPQYPPSEAVSMNVYNYGGYLQLQLRNNTNRAVTCQGQVTWRYQNSSSDSYAGVYAYVQPNTTFTQNVSISNLLYLAWARPDIKCN